MELLHLYILATSLYAFGIWTIFPLKMGVSATPLQKRVLVYRQLFMRFYGKDKWWHNFDAKEKYGFNFIAKASVNMALVQGQMLAQLHGKDSWCGYVAKTLDVAALQRQVLVQLNCQDEGQYNFKVKY